jgi:chromosome segregation ATPase
LKNKIIDLFDRLKSGKGQTSDDVSHVESIVSQKYEEDIYKLNKKISHLEKENREQLSSITQKQNDYETSVQRNNILNREIDNLKSEAKKLQMRADTLLETIQQKDKRIQDLVKERGELSVQMKDLQLKTLESKHNESNEDLIKNLKAENAIFKSILKNSNVQKGIQPSSDITTLQKREADLTKEIDGYRQKIYAYKQMLTEYNMMLSIYKEGDNEQEDFRGDVDETRFDDLMQKLKINIQM